MNLLLFIFIYNLIKSVNNLSNPVCKGHRYQCSLNVNFGSLVCAKIIDEKQKIRALWPCPNNYTCNTQNLSHTQPAYCELIQESKLIYPGEACTSNTDCYSQKCEKNICRGQDEGGLCSNHSDCNVGYFCCNDTEKLTGNCKSQLIFGASCEEDYQCQNNCVCSLGKCTYYYAYDNKIPADHPMACASGYIANGTCSEGLMSMDLNRPKPCESVSDCPLVDSNKTIIKQSECQCGYNAGSFSYCALGEGDPEYVDMLNGFQYILNTNFLCHTMLRYGPCKMIYTDEYINYNRALKKFKLLPQITFNDFCIQKVYNWDYWKWEVAALASEGSILASLAGVWLLLGAI